MHHADSVLSAAAVLARVSPTWLLVRPELPWHRSFVEALPAAKRPAVVAVGGSGVSAAFADEWLASFANAGEVAERLRLAGERARDRRQRARRTLLDPLTRLPNRRAVARGLLVEAARVRREGGTVALVLLSLSDYADLNQTRGRAAADRLLRDAGAALRRVVRGTELCGRIRQDMFALVLAGELRDADRPASRLAEALRAKGISASMAVAILEPRETLLHLYRRTGQLLRDARPKHRAPLAREDQGKAALSRIS